MSNSTITSSAPVSSTDAAVSSSIASELSSAAASISSEATEPDPAATTTVDSASPTSDDTTTPPATSQGSDTTTTAEASDTDTVVTSRITASAPDPTTQVVTSVVTEGTTRGDGVVQTGATTIIVTNSYSPSTTNVVYAPRTRSSATTGTATTSQPAALSNAGGDGNGNGSGGGGGLSTGGTTALAVVLPVAFVAALVGLGIFLWRKRRQRTEAQEQRRKEVEDYGYNPNQDPSMPPAAGAGAGAPEMTQDSSRRLLRPSAAVTRRASSRNLATRTVTVLARLGIRERSVRHQSRTPTLALREGRATLLLHIRTAQDQKDRMSRCRACPLEVLDRHTITTQLTAMVTASMVPTAMGLTAAGKTMACLLCAMCPPVGTRGYSKAAPTDKAQVESPRTSRRILTLGPMCPARVARRDLQANALCSGVISSSLPAMVHGKMTLTTSQLDRGLSVFTIPSYPSPSRTPKSRMKWDLATKKWIPVYEDISVDVSDGGGLSRNTSHASSDSRKRKRGGHDDNHGTPHEAKKEDGDGDGDGYGEKGGDSTNLSRNF
ncbi:hypothetical protein KC326_g102 [Hortaea werneckii]|nr:hypothetical protein KC326_g102 [Hortaea werneckii]